MNMFMKLCLFMILLGLNSVSAQSIFGKWKTVDDNDIEKSIVEIYEENGEVFGKVTRILKDDERDKRCTECKDEQKDQKIEGMVIIKNLTKDEGKYANGEITDPENGKTYDAEVWLDEENPDRLKVKGSLLVFSKTQEWKRVKD